ncbi:MAG: ribonuclease III [Treponema sp.]|nr:ribonuclease III [Treponema sp.]
MLTNLLNPSKNNILSLERKNELAAFQKAAGFKFRNLSLLNQSFMHRSVSNETGNKANNERLEFLGDSILGAVCATLLYQSYHDKSEGELAKIKAVVVSEEVLSQIALDLKIDKMLLLGKGEQMSGGRTKKTILADAMEAVIGALYIDSGYKCVFDFVSRCIKPQINKVTGDDFHKDYKSILQEFCQQQFKCYPEYNMVKRTGPEHERTFWIEVCIGKTVYGTGKGRNKKSAEQDAAKMAYLKINT